jgi:hypothetical protein
VGWVIACQSARVCEGGVKGEKLTSFQSTGVLDYLLSAVKILLVPEGDGEQQ